MKSVVDDEANSTLFERIFDIDQIKNTISRIDNMSAAGRDGISKVIWKFCPTITSVLVKRIIKSMLNHSKMPDSWRKTKSVLIFKKGDPSSVGNWRPIALTPTLYRIVMCHISDCVLRLDSDIKLLSTQQKGFKKGVNGSTEHILTLNELIADATRQSKEINLLTINFADAFGSVSHTHI
ncbi:hypothetical protein TRFO_33291 [Tritrichomonas foetus]|uniref:Reverse transcriptase domain-containing protein n=1 Tax=Tritrichomonas foetus TaxID=1144522 RepID=A0A1J4JRC3_9EUKA|nr:hypothetical protein TRFO_33291 [Tritrichomonas foetus]|eukprot:OHT00060.1 hypothetical protein TRFO_33291 [Tritrichomonas foetus]